jgi:hypothetical protein
MPQPLSRGLSSGPYPLPAFLALVRHLPSSFGWLLDPNLWATAVNMTLAFCMGQDLEGLMNSSLGQPMAQIFLNSFGKTGTLAAWAFIILAQYMMGSSMVRFLSFPRSVGGRRLLIGSQMLAASRQSFALYVLTCQTARLSTDIVTQCAGWCSPILELALPHEQLYQDTS